MLCKVELTQYALQFDIINGYSSCTTRTSSCTTRSTSITMSMNTMSTWSVPGMVLCCCVFIICPLVVGKSTCAVFFHFVDCTRSVVVIQYDTVICCIAYYIGLHNNIIMLSTLHDDASSQAPPVLTTVVVVVSSSSRYGTVPLPSASIMVLVPPVP